MDSVNESAVAQEKAKKSFGGRIVGWLIRAAIVIGVVYFLSGLREDQQANFVESVAADAVAKCEGDAGCLENLAENFESCFKSHAESRRSGKYNRKYSLRSEEHTFELQSREN